MKKIGIIGSGIVGKTLATGLADLGHEVMVGSRSPENLNEWQREQAKEISLGTFDETANFGELLILAVKGTVAKTVLESIKPENLQGKTIMDATNPIADEAIDDGVLKFFTSDGKSLMEILQDSFPKSHFVKGFNSVGSGQMVQPQYESKPSMFICGNNEAAKQEVAKLAQSLGWEVEDMGTAKAAASIESLCILWCIKGFRENQWNHAFKILNP